jgi:hypothetical protein
MISSTRRIAVGDQQVVVTQHKGDIVLCIDYGEDEGWSINLTQEQVYHLCMNLMVAVGEAGNKEE